MGYYNTGFGVGPVQGPEQTQIRVSGHVVVQLSVNEGALRNSTRNYSGFYLNPKPTKHQVRVL